MNRALARKAPRPSMRQILSWIVSTLTVACIDGSPESGSPSKRILWRMELLPNEVYAWRGIPAVHDGVAFWKTTDGLLAFDIATGKRRWATPLPIKSIQAPNVLYQDGLVAISDWWGVTVADAEDGHVVWSAPDTTMRHDTYLDARDNVLFHFLTTDTDFSRGPFVGVLKAVDLRTGASRWEHLMIRQDSFSVIPTGVVIADDVVYAIGGRSQSVSGHLKTVFVFAFRRSDGTLLWHSELPGEFHAPSINATVSGSLLIMGDQFASGFFALDRSDGHLVWKFPGEPGWIGPNYAPLLADGIAYGVSGDRHAYAFDPTTGNKHWTTKLPASAFHLALCGRYLLVENQAVMLVDRKSGVIVDSLLASPDRNEIPTSGFAVSGDVAAISTDSEIIGFSCK